MTAPEQPTPLNEICDECGARMGEHIIGPGGYHPRPVSQKSPTTEAIGLAMLYGIQKDERRLALAIDDLAAQRAAEAVEPWKREYEDAVTSLRTERHLFRISVEKTKAATPPPGDAGERARGVPSRLYDRPMSQEEIDQRANAASDAERFCLRACRGALTDFQYCDALSRINIVLEAALQSERTAAASQARRETWQPIETAPTGWGNFFLVKPKGRHPGIGKPWVPTVVQFVDGELYAPDNELTPLYLGQREPDGHPCHTELEWHPLPVLATPQESAP